MASAVESADSSIKQLESNLTSAANAVESAGLSYQIAKENAEDTQRQQQDFELYTKPASTTAIGSQLVGSDAQLAAAVSNAGGLGIIAAGNADGTYVREQIKKAKEEDTRCYLVSEAAEEAED